MRKLILALVAAAAVSTSAQAAGGYGTAGCGLGAVILGDKPGFTQVFAATLNDILLWNQTFGITFGTLNCGGPASSALAAKNFIETNREALAKDIARGQGETVKNLATISGCADSAAVGATLQKNFTNIFPSAGTSDTQVSDSIITTLQSDKALACGKLG